MSFTPHAIRVAGIGPHNGTEIDFDSMPPVSAIFGATGTGKTTLVSGMVLSLYPSAPIGGGKLARIEKLMPAHADNAEIALTFSANGNRYTSTRTVRGSVSEHVVMDYNGAVVAGPKLRDAAAFIDATLGSAEAFLSTLYCARDSAHDLVACSEADRRKRFGEFLDFARLDGESERHHTRAKDCIAKAKVLTARIDPTPREQREADMRALVDALESARTEHTTNARRIEEQEGRLESLRTESQRMEAMRRDTLSALSEAVSARQDVTRISTDIERFTAEARAALDEANGIEFARQAAADLVGVASEVDIAEHRLDRHREWQATQARMEADLARLNAIIESSGANITDEQRDAAGRVKELADAALVLRSDEMAARGRLDGAREGVEILRAKRDGSLAALGSLRARAASKPETPGAPDVCATCPLLREFADLPRQIEAAEKAVEIADAELANAVEVMDGFRARLIPMARVEAAARAHHEAVSAARAIALAEEAEAKRARAIAEADSVRENIFMHSSSEDHLGPDFAEDLRALRVRRSELERAAAKLPACEAAVGRQARIAAEIDAARTRLSEAEAGARKAEDISKRMTEAFATLDTGRDWGAEIEAANRELREARAASESCARNIASLEARIEAAAERNAREERELAELDATNRDAEDLAMLARIFGPRGVQPILIDSAFPQLDGLMAETLAAMTEGQMQAMWTTTKATGNGEAEGFLLTVTDAKGTRDASLCSGGETAILSLSVRLALCRWIAARNGTAPGTLIVDEALNTVSDELVPVVISAVRRAADAFGLRVVFVTPRWSVAEAIGGGVILEPGFQSVHVREF